MDDLPIAARALFERSAALLPSAEVDALRQAVRDHLEDFRAEARRNELREVCRAKGWLGVAILHQWVKWAQRSRLDPFVKLARSIRKHAYDIGTTLLYDLSNARLESTATKMRVLHRQSFGLHDPQPLIDLAMLKLGGLCPPLVWQR